jgi:hypothetical protein
MDRSALARRLLNRHLVLAAYLVCAAGASVAQYFKGHPGEEYTRYNNYIIFRESFHHLSEGKDLYAAHPGKHFDHYKYSPAFAVLFAPFSLAGDLPGLTAWNLLNALTLFFAVRLLPGLDDRKKNLALWIILPELITSMQNSQSNGLVAALGVGAFVAFGRRRMGWAAFLIVCSAAIKLFGAATALLFILFERRWRFILAGLGWTLVFAALPLAVTTPALLGMQYQSWLGLLQADHAASLGISVYGLAAALAGGQVNKDILLMAGIVLLLAPGLFVSHYLNERFRLLWLASVLLWVVLFNHRAESPTYVIAVTAVALWFVASEPGWLSRALLILVLVLTVFSPTDLFPRAVREQWVVPYSLKALPCLLVWLRITYQLMAFRRLRKPAGQDRGKPGSALTSSA